MNNIQKYREKAKITQEELAKRLSISQGAISHYENGRRDVDLDTCRKIANFFNRCGLNVSVDDIFPPTVK